MSNHGHKTVTSIDVAKRAGVSQSTVSRAFSCSGKLSPKTREAVIQAANELGYRPNAIARSLVSNQTKFIGIVKSATDNSMFSELLTFMVERLQKTEYQVIYYEVGHGQSIDDILSRVLQYRVEGIILLYANLSSEITRVCRNMGIPVLQMLRYSTNAQANVVSPANHAGAALAVEHLLEKGYRSFAYITGELNASSNMERQLGFLSRLAELGYNDPVVLQGDYTYESGCRAFPLLMEHSPKLPCGVLCANDLIAMGVIDTARAMNIRIPEDIGVMGFDNIFMSNWPAYQLTSLQNPTEELADRGIQLLIDKIQNNDFTPDILQLNFKLVERRSTQLTGSPK